MIKIITDATCDFLTEFYNTNNIELIPMNYMINGETFVDDKNINIKEFYENLRQGKMPTTSMITPTIYEEVFEKFLKEGNDVLYIGFSSGLSGCYNASLLAKRSLEQKYSNKIYCLDSLSASMGMGILIKMALNMVENNKTFEEIIEKLEFLKRKLCILLGVDNLFHLERGGRIGKATAIIGTTLNLKPIIKVNEEGKLVTFKKVLGRKKMMLTLLNTLSTNLDNDYKDKIYIINGDCEEDALELKNKIDNLLKTESLVVSLGTIIGTHAGNNALAVIFVAKENIENVK